MNETNDRAKQPKLSRFTKVSFCQLILISLYIKYSSSTYYPRLNLIYYNALLNVFEYFVCPKIKKPFIGFVLLLLHGC